MKSKKINFKKTDIDTLPNNNPALYRIKTEGNNTNYIGVAKRGRISDRLSEHLDNIPGAKVELEFFSSIQDAKTKEERVIKLNQPKYNTQNK